MKTYTATVKFNQYIDVYTDQTAKQIKALKARVAADGEGWSITVVEGTPVAKCYDTRYGIEVTYIEARQNGYTLVYSAERGQYFANTVQIEWR